MIQIEVGCNPECCKPRSAAEREVKSVTHRWCKYAKCNNVSPSVLHTNLLVAAIKCFHAYIYSEVAKKLPAAGNRNGTSVNNVGTNGNYWSSSYNNENNAYNMNFNSDNVNPSNNNNRYNGQSVRLVADLTADFDTPFSM